MRVANLLLLLFIISNVCTAQDTTSCPCSDILPALKDNRLKKGVYTCLREFGANKPAIEGDVVVKDKSEAAQFFLLSGKDQLLVKGPSGHEQKLKKTAYWGYCDGNAVYINDQGLKKLEEIGDYCIYEQTCYAYRPGYYNTATNTGSAGGNVRYLAKKVLDLSTGQTFDLTVSNVKKVLEKDARLLSEFEKDDAQADRLVDYIQRYNKTAFHLHHK